MSRMKRMFSAIGGLFVPLKPTDCDAFNTLSNGFAKARAVESELEKATGLKPRVSFDWRNGRLATVTVVFPRLDDARPLREWAAPVREAVRNQLRQAADNIVVGFSLGRTS